jgi:hypothetical protein
MEYDPVPGTKSSDPLPHRIILCHDFQVAGGELVTCWADAAARLRFPTNPPWELIAYVEYDRSTMTHSQMRDKFAAWEQFFAQRTYSSHWPEIARHIVRLLIICRSEARIKNLAETLADSALGAHVRMATESSLQPTALFNQPIWQTLDRKQLAILKTSFTAINAAT